MADDIEAGEVFGSSPTNRRVTYERLNNHVNNATIKPTFVSSKPNRDTIDQSDNVLLLAGNAYFRATLAALKHFVLSNDSILRAMIADGAINSAKLDANAEDFEARAIERFAQISSERAQRQFRSASPRIRRNAGVLRPSREAQEALRLLGSRQTVGPSRLAVMPSHSFRRGLRSRKENPSMPWGRLP